MWSQRLCPNHLTPSLQQLPRERRGQFCWGREKSQEGLSGNFQRGARYQKMHRHSAGKYGREEPPLGKARQVLRPRKEKCQRMVALGSCKWGVRRRLQS